MQYPQTKTILNQLVADLSQMAAVIHQTHWYMRGPEFLFLHPLMDDYQDEINDQLDEIAERLITIDGAPYSTLEDFASHTGIQSIPGSFDATMEERFAHLVAGYRHLEKVYQEGIETAGQEGDDSTQDLLIAGHSLIEKRIWMLQAQRGHAPEIDE